MLEGRCAAQAPHPIGRSCLLDMKPDRAPWLVLRWYHELSDRLKQRLNMFIVAGDLPFQFCELVSQRPVRSQYFPKPSEDQNRLTAGLNGD